MVNYTPKKTPAAAIEAVQEFLRTGGTIHRVEPKSTKESDRWVLRLRMLHGSKGHAYVR